MNTNMNKEFLNIAFSGLSAVSAVTGMCVLLWGVFFTSLPEKLISELNTDIKSQKEIQIDLIQNNRDLQKNLDILKEINLNAKQENYSLKNNIEILKNSKLEYEKELKNYRSKLASSDVAKLQNALFFFGIEVNKKLKKAEDIAKFGSAYFEMLQWLKQEPKRPDFPDGSIYIFQKKYDSNLEEFRRLQVIHDQQSSEWYSIQPDDGNYYIMFRMRRFCRDCGELESYRGMTYNQFWHKKMDTFTNSKTLTAKKIFHEVQNEVLQEVEQRIKQKFIILLNEFISKNHEVFELNLNPSFSENNSDRHIIEGSKVILKNIDKAQELVEAFSNILAKKEI
jgi:hypothetical protein